MSVSSAATGGSGTAVAEYEELRCRVLAGAGTCDCDRGQVLPNKGDKTRLTFEADVPLWPGSNLVQVFARETNEIQSVQTVVVLDRGTATMVQKTGGATGPMGK